MNTSLTSLKRLSLSLTLALATVVALAIFLNAVSAQSATSSVLHAPASEPPQDPPACPVDFIIALDRSGSMQEETRCYGCWVQAGDYPSGTTYPLPFGDHCDPSDPITYEGYSYVSIEAEHYSRYLTEADYHREWTEFPKIWWAMQRQPDRNASGPDSRGAWMMVGPHSADAMHYETIGDIVYPPDLFPTPRLDYDFTVPTGGTYYVWIRAQGGNPWWGDGHRRVHVGLNGAPMATATTPMYGGYNTGAVSDNWRWTRALTLPGLVAGTSYTLNFWAAGPGFRLDKIVITEDPRTNLDENGLPLDWDFPGVTDAGPVETHGRTFWACMGPGHPTPDPRFEPIDPISGERDDLYDDYQVIRDAKEAAKKFVRRLNPTLDQIGYVYYSTSASIREELYCIERYGSCSDFETVVSRIEATFANGGTNIADAMWDGLRVLTTGREPANDGTGLPSKDPGTWHYGRPSAAHILILVTDGIPNYYPELPPGYGTCYEHDLWPDVPGESTYQRRARECAVYFAHLARDTDVTIFTIGLGPRADGELLAHVADVTGGGYYYAASGEDIEGILKAVSEEAHFACWPPGVTLVNYATPDYVTHTGAEIHYVIQSTFQLSPTVSLAVGADARANLVAHLPDGTDFVTADAPYELDGDHVVWPISDTEASARWARRHLTLTVNETAGVALVNTAQFVDVASGSVEATATVTTTFLPALTYDLKKRAEPSTTVSVGRRVTFTLWLTTNGPHFAAVFTDHLPPHTVFVTATAPFSPAQPTATQPLIWPLTRTHFGPGGVVSRTLVLSLSPIPSGDVWTNTALGGDYIGFHIVRDSVVVHLAPGPVNGLSPRVYLPLVMKNSH